jgi:hypothetical protein
VALLPAVTKCMLDLLPPEPFDPDFAGQDLDTTYFDTPDFDLRKARLRKDRYLTLRIRRYAACGLAGNDRAPAFALSAKTESTKFRADVPAPRAILALRNPAALAELLQAALPADQLARLLDLTGGADLAAVAMVCCRRCAGEDDCDRLTLDAAVRTDLGKTLPFAVLDDKSTRTIEGENWAAPPGMRPIKLSKFLWAAEVPYATDG